MSTDWAFRTKGTDHARYPQKPGRTFARKRDQWIAERMPAVRRRRAAAALASRVGASAPKAGWSNATITVTPLSGGGA